MKTNLRYGIAAFLLAISMVHAVAATNAPKTPAKHPAPKTAKSAGIPDVAYPFTFICKHCGMKMTVKSPADWSKPCQACPCGTSMLGCYKG